jgi:hypothetical protein
LLQVTEDPALTLLLQPFPKYFLLVLLRVVILHDAHVLLSSIRVRVAILLGDR